MSDVLCRIRSECHWHYASKMIPFASCQVNLCWHKFGCPYLAGGLKPLPSETRTSIVVETSDLDVKNTTGSHS
jgi:hypothetical protein